MELSEACQKALLRMLGTFCLEEMGFRDQVQVSATFMFHVDEALKYQFATEKTVKRNEASVYKKASCHRETQTDLEPDHEPDHESDYEPLIGQQKLQSGLFENTAVKIEVDSHGEASDCVAAESDSVTKVRSRPQSQTPAKRGRKPKKKQSSSCPLCPVTFKDEEAVEEHLKTFHDLDSEYKRSQECLSTVKLIEQINQTLEKSKQKTAGAEKRVTRSKKSAPKKATKGIVKSKPNSKKKTTAVKKKPVKDEEEDNGDGFEDFGLDSLKEKTTAVKKKQISDDSYVPESKTSPQVKCADCGKLYNSRRALRRHFATVHELREYQCEICGKNFTGKESLYHHRRGMHTDLKPYKCAEPGCEASFNFNHSLRLHKLKHSGSRPHQCSECGKTYLTGYHLKVHYQATHTEKKQYSCSACGKMFSYSTSLKMHEASHVKSLRVRCNQCDKTFVNSQALKYHVMSKHSEPGHFQCNLCDKVYKTEFLLRAHKRRHTTDGTRFMCDLCGRQFMYKSALEMHKAVHKDEKSFQCNICNKTFKTYPTLYSHRYVHKAEEPYKCSECGKAFKTKERCKAHSRRHSGLKPFECKICHHCFPDKGGLSKHMKTVHCAVKKFVCEICGKAASRADNLRVHMKVHYKGESPAPKLQALAIREVNLGMPTVVPHTMNDSLHTKDQDDKRENSVDNSLGSAVVTSGQNSQNQPGRMISFNQSIPNLPTLDSSHILSPSEEQSLPLNLQNPSNPAAAAGVEHREHLASDHVTLASLQTQQFVYAPPPWQGYVYTTTGVQPQPSGTNTFFQ